MARVALSWLHRRYSENVLPNYELINKSPENGYRISLNSILPQILSPRSTFSPFVTISVYIKGVNYLKLSDLKKNIERLMKHALISNEQWQKDPLSRLYHHWLGYPCKPTLWPLKHTSLASIEADLFLRPFRKVKDVLKVPLEMLFSDVQSVERLRSPVDFDKTTRMSLLIKS